VTDKEEERPRNGEHDSGPDQEIPPRYFPSAEEDHRFSGLAPDTLQTRSPAYRLGFADTEFIMRDELRAERLQLEFLKPDILQRDRGISATVVMFGSTRIPAPEQAAALLEEAEREARERPGDSRAAQRLRAVNSLVAKGKYYQEARRLARMISAGPMCDEPGAELCKYPHGPFSVVVVTGGGPGIMEAANRGAAEVGAESVGHNIVLPFEQRPNEYITPYLCFNFHYFALRKMHFMLRAIALAVFPGGFGTLDELFEVLTLIQTRKTQRMPVLLFAREYWERILNFPAMVEEGVINPHDLEIFTYVETADEAWVHLEPLLRANMRRR
jgi:uncharacterized protein (TIGR00730 family)